MPIRIVIADDHPIFRQGLIKLLETKPDLEVVGAAADGDEAMTLVAARNPELLLLDLAMPKMAGLVALRFPDEEVKGERKNDPNEAALDRGPHAQLPVAPLESRQINGQRDEDAHVKGHPKPDIRGHGADGSMARLQSQWESVGN